MRDFISVEIFAVARPWRLAMESIDLQSMSLDELWASHEMICLILARKLEAEKRSHEQRLNELGRRIGRAANATPLRRSYPKVRPKFRNPEPPHQTWSGRGLQPSWVRELLAAGKKTDDLGISTPTAYGSFHSGRNEPPPPSLAVSFFPLGIAHRPATMGRPTTKKK